eukprot:1657992-Alexandrium_andersonii.AAC.1
MARPSSALAKPSPISKSRSLTDTSNSPPSGDNSRCLRRSRKKPVPNSQKQSWALARIKETGWP